MSGGTIDFRIRLTVIALVALFHSALLAETPVKRAEIVNVWGFPAVSVTDPQLSNDGKRLYGLWRNLVLKANLGEERWDGLIDLTQYPPLEGPRISNDDRFLFFRSGDQVPIIDAGDGTVRAVLEKPDMTVVHAETSRDDLNLILVLYSSKVGGVSSIIQVINLDTMEQVNETEFDGYGFSDPPAFGIANPDVITIRCAYPYSKRYVWDYTTGELTRDESPWYEGARESPSGLLSVLWLPIACAHRPPDYTLHCEQPWSIKNRTTGIESDSTWYEASGGNSVRYSSFSHWATLVHIGERDIYGSVLWTRPVDTASNQWCLSPVIEGERAGNYLTSSNRDRYRFFDRFVSVDIDQQTKLGSLPRFDFSTGLNTLSGTNNLLLQEGNYFALLQPHEDRIVGPAFPNTQVDRVNISSDGRFAVLDATRMNSPIRTISLWNMERLRWVIDLDEWVQGLDVSEDNSTLVLSDFRVLSIRSLPRGELINEIDTGVFESAPCEFTSGGSRVATWKDGAIMLFDSETGERLATQTQASEESYIWNRMVASPNGHHLATSSPRLPVRVWDGDTLEMLYELPASPNDWSSVLFSQDSTMMIVTYHSSFPRVVGVETGSGDIVANYPISISWVLNEKAAAFAYGGFLVYTLGEGGCIVSYRAVYPDGRENRPMLELLDVADSGLDRDINGDGVLDAADMIASLESSTAKTMGPPRSR